MSERDDHWNQVYSEKRPDEVSWYQGDPTLSLELIRSTGVDTVDPIIDVGAGASFLSDRLLAEGFVDVSVLDISETALQYVRERLDPEDARVRLVHADLLAFKPKRHYALWHDRAVFHFLTEPEDRRRYVAVLSKAVRPGGHVIIATFALGGPTKCSGLPVVNYDPPRLASELGAEFELVQVADEDHPTPSGTVQPFQYCVFHRVT